MVWHLAYVLQRRMFLLAVLIKAMPRIETVVQDKSPYAVERLLKQFLWGAHSRVYSKMLDPSFEKPRG